jgi:hypothetical protein
MSPSSTCRWRRTPRALSPRRARAHARTHTHTLGALAASGSPVREAPRSKRSTRPPRPLSRRRRAAGAKRMLGAAPKARATPQRACAHALPPTPRPPAPAHQLGLRCGRRLRLRRHGAACDGASSDGVLKHTLSDEDGQSPRRAAPRLRAARCAARQRAARCALLPRRLEHRATTERDGPPRVFWPSLHNFFFSHFLLHDDATQKR